MSFNEWYTLENRNYPDAGWLVGLFGVGEGPCLDTQCLLWILFSAFVVAGNKETSIYWKRREEGNFFLKCGKYAERLPILSHWASGMKGSELTSIFTDDSYLKGIDSTNSTYPQFSPLKSSETSDFAEHLVGSGVIALLSGCFSARIVSLPSRSGC